MLSKAIKAARFVYWNTIQRSPALQRQFERLLFPGTPRMVPLLGTSLYILPRREIAYYSASRAEAGRQVFRNEVPKMLALFSLLRPGTCFVDCGANVGLWSAAAARLARLHAGMTVLSFEANPDTFKRLSTTLAAYPVARCFNVALSDSGRMLEMAEGASSLAFGVPGSRFNKGAKPVRIQAAPLDQYIAGCRDILLKVDVEGHELEVLNGASKALAGRRVRAVVIDGFPPRAAAPIRDLLRLHDFELFDATGLEGDKGGTGALFALRRDETAPSA